MAKVGVMGAGAWGTAVGSLLSQKGHDVVLWSHDESTARDILTEHQNSRYLPGVLLPEGLGAVCDAREAATEKDYLILAVPSLYLLDSVRQILTVPNIMEGETFIGVLTKGFVTVRKGTRLIIETLEDYLPGFYKNNLVYISGPSHAEEVVRKKLTGLISASANPKNSIRFRELLTCNWLKIFSSLDVVGVQVSAAIKNVVAIAFGILDAFKEMSEGFGDNTESLLLAGGLNEIQTLGLTLGSTHPETFTSIAGVGDLDVTCRSQYGRNRRFGRSIVLDNILSPYSGIDHLIDSIDAIGYLPEGVVAARAVREIMSKHALKLPVVNGVYRILNREAEPFDEMGNILRTP